MSDISQSQSSDIVSEKKNPSRRQGKASKQKHQDAFREKKGAAELAKIHAAAAKRTYEDLDLAAGLELIAKLHIQSSKVEAQVPATTRAAGFLSNQVLEEATVVAPRAVQNSGITAPQIYRVTLSQIAVQQNLALKKSNDLQDSVVNEHQPEFIPQDAAEQVLTTGKTFGVLSHLVNSFGLVRNGARTFRTYVPPHPAREGEPQQVREGIRRRAIPRRLINPDPYYVTIQSLRDVVTALADPETPHQVRVRFRQNNPIPSAQWDENDILLNPDILCPADYLNSGQFQRDLDTFRRFISSAGSKMKTYFSECLFTGSASNSMFVTASTTACRLEEDELIFDSDNTFRSQYELSDQTFVAGAIALIGESVNNLAFRDPTIMTSRIDVSWRALVRDLLIKE